MTNGDEAGDAQTPGERLASLELAVAERDARLAEQAAQLAAQAAQIAALTEQVAKLTELLNRNSRNSHLPPSSDGPGSGVRGASGKSRGKSGRQRGGQKGHRGSHRALLPAEHVDTVINLFPEACEGCAHPLFQVEDAAACRYQQLDLRDHRPHVTEWRRHEVRCEHCRAWTRAAYDPAEIPSTAFGPCLTAVVALLTGAYHLSRRKTQKLLLELFGIGVSLGAISTMEQRASEALRSSHDEALREVQYAEVKHSDATTWTRSGKLMSLWVLATVTATVYRILDDGRSDTIRPLFGPRVGVLVSDRATVFGFWAMALRQVCHAHLLRKFVSFSERDGPAGALGRELLECTALMFEYWHGYKDGHLTRQELQFWMRPVQRTVEQLLERGERLDLQGVSGSCADILAHREALWTFVSQDGVEPTSRVGGRRGGRFRSCEPWPFLPFRASVPLERTVVSVSGPRHLKPDRRISRIRLTARVSSIGVMCLFRAVLLSLGGSGSCSHRRDPTTRRPPRYSTASTRSPCASAA